MEILRPVLPVAWTVVASAYFWVFLRDDQGVARNCRKLAWGAVALHVLAFGAVALQGLPPVASAGGLLSGVGLSVALVYLFLERRIGALTTGVFPIALVALLTTAAAAAGDPLDPLSPALRSWSVSGHIASAILGDSGLLLAAMFGVLYLAQRRAMRGREFGLLWERLPSLELLDGFTRGSLVAAFIFLTVTIGLGHAGRYAIDAPGGYWDAKIIATNVLWLLVGIVLLGRISNRIRPAVASGAAVVLFALAVVNLVLVDPFSAVHSSY